MTTIVCTRSGMAADKRVSGGPRFKTTKIFHVGGSLIGIAGRVEHALKFIEWRNKPSDAKPSFADSPDFEALELAANGKITWWGPEMVGIPIEEKFYAIGSGSTYALGAMAMGASPEAAIKIAARWDNSTGAEIQVASLEAAK